MTFLLDTSILIDLLRQKSDIVDFIKTHESDEMITSSICAFELFSGVYMVKDKERSLHERVSQILSSLSHVSAFDEEQADIAGQFYAALSKSGTKISDIDTLIAASAHASGATLVTKNPKHFERLTQIQIIAL